MRKMSETVLLIMAVGCLLSGCAKTGNTQSKSEVVDTKTNQIDDRIIEETEPSKEKTEPKTLHFVDAFGQSYQTTINDRIEKHSYKDSSFQRDGQMLSYEDDVYTSRLGIDVSHHQGEIDWQQVKEYGITFAFIRIGYRGYGESGSLNLDQRVFDNIKGAQAAGLDVGVYFFSQAINEDEAIEEAQTVIDALNGYMLTLPVVYDPESILDDEARTDDVTGAQFTKNTVAFCETIKAAGYEPMIYSNMLWEAFELDMEQLSAYEIWYADYEMLPQTPYHFLFWQYTNEAQVPGIEGEVDLNIQMMKKTSE